MTEEELLFHQLLHKHIPKITNEDLRAIKEAEPRQRFGKSELQLLHFMMNNRTEVSSYCLGEHATGKPSYVKLAIKWNRNVFILRKKRDAGEEVPINGELFRRSVKQLADRYKYEKAMERKNTQN